MSMQSSGTGNVFTKGKSCLINLISFYDNVIHLVDEGKMVGVVFVDFRKVFDTVPHNILLDKLSNCRISGFPSVLDEELAEGQSSGGCSEWGYICLATTQQRCSSRFNSRTSSVQYIYQ